MSVKTKLDLLFVLYISGITNASICTNNQAIFFQWSAWSECTGSEHSRLCYADQSYETAICGSPTTTVTMTTARTTTLMTRSSFTTVPHFGKPEAAICTENQAIFFQWEAWGPCAGGTRSRHCYADDKYEHETCGGAITSVVTTASHVTYTNTDMSEIHSTSSPTDTRNCADLPCENGGHCTQLPVGHHCACPGDYTGDNCEKYLFPRFDNTCRTNSSCYAVFSEAIMWRDAQKFCAARLGHLAVLNDLSEALHIETFVESMRSRYSELVFWLGGTVTTSGTVEWLKGEPSSVTRWLDGLSPSMSSPECLALDGNIGFRWRPMPCEKRLNFICEERQLYHVGLLG